MKREHLRELRRTNSEANRARLRELVQLIFEHYSTPQERTRVCLEKFGIYFEALGDGAQQLESGIIAAEAFDEKERFVTALVQALEPLIELQERDPALVEKIKRNDMIEKTGLLRLNEVFYVGIQNGIAHLHLAESVHVGGKLSLFRDALQQLAQMAQHKPKLIRELCLTSPIVASNPNILERFGFTDIEPIDDETRAAHFQDDDPDTLISRARMTREELIAKWLRDTE